MNRSSLFASSLAVALVCTASACSDSSTAPKLPSTTATQELVVDASTGFAYVQLGDTAKIVSVTDPTTSSTWDIGLYATSVSINGGSAGPGGVGAACLCPSTSPTDAQVQSFTAAGARAAFDTVTTASMSSSITFVGDSLQPALKGWYNGTAGVSATAKTALNFIIVEGTQVAYYSKFHVTAITGATATSPGQVTFEYATQPTPGASPFGTLQSRTVTIGATPVYFDLKTGAETTSSGAWTLEFKGWQIRANGGASGTGSVSVVDASPFTLDQISIAFAQSVPVAAFSRDVFSGVFGTYPWFRYNITGSDNQIWPVFSVYLVKRGTSIYKVQLTSYYNTQGQSRRITLRYARIAR